MISKKELKQEIAELQLEVGRLNEIKSEFYILQAEFNCLVREAQLKPTETEQLYNCVHPWLDNVFYSYKPIGGMITELKNNERLLLEYLRLKVTETKVERKIIKKNNRKETT